MKTIEQLTGTTDFKTNLLCFLLLSGVLVGIVAFSFLACINGISSF